MSSCAREVDGQLGLHRSVLAPRATHPRDQLLTLQHSLQPLFQPHLLLITRHLLLILLLPMLLLLLVQLVRSKEGEGGENLRILFGDAPGFDNVLNGGDVADEEGAPEESVRRGKRSARGAEMSAEDELTSIDGGIARVARRRDHGR
jgi:hypothetical protein